MSASPMPRGTKRVIEEQNPGKVQASPKRAKLKNTDTPAAKLDSGEITAPAKDTTLPIANILDSSPQTLTSDTPLTKSRHRGTAKTLYSNTFVILVGQEKERITVHENAFRHSGSQALQKMVGKEWKEGIDKVVDWSHTDKDTILYALSFLYSGSIDLKDDDDDDDDIKNEDSAPDDTLQKDKGGGAKAIGNGLSPSAALKATANPPILPGTPFEIELWNVQGFKDKKSASPRHRQQEKDFINKILTYPNPTKAITRYAMAFTKLYVFAHAYLLSDLRQYIRRHFGFLLVMVDHRSADSILPCIPIASEGLPTTATVGLVTMLHCFVAYQFNILSPGNVFALMDDDPELRDAVLFTMSRCLHERDDAIAVRVATRGYF